MKVAIRFRYETEVLELSMQQNILNSHSILVSTDN